MPIRTVKEDDYVYVNHRQYLRILQRRAKRKKLFSSITIPGKPKYIHKSRHVHAMTRERGKGGRFVKKNKADNEEVKINTNQEK